MAPVEDTTTPTGDATLPTPPVPIETIRLVVVDDSEEVRRLVRRAFAHDETVEIVGEAGDGAEAVTVVSVTRPDVVVMDIRMPGTDGIAATRQIKAEYPTIEVIAFSSDGTGQVEMVDAGASYFAFKGEPIGELAKTIRSLAAMKRASERHDIPPFVLEAITDVEESCTVTRIGPDSTSAIVYANQAFETLTGYTAEEVIGRGHDFWLAFGFDIDQWTEIEAHLRAGEEWRDEIHAPAKHGDPVDVDLTLTPFIAEDQLYVVGVARRVGHVAPVVATPPHEDASEWAAYVPFDLSAEFELYPRAKERFLSLPETKQREIIFYVNEGADGRREMRIGNVVMSLDD